jgi:hypothetical protein
VVVVVVRDGGRRRVRCGVCGAGRKKRKAVMG